MLRFLFQFQFFIQVFLVCVKEANGCRHRPRGLRPRDPGERPGEDREGDHARDQAPDGEEPEERLLVPHEQLRHRWSCPAGLAASAFDCATANGELSANKACCGIIVRGRRSID